MADTKIHDFTVNFFEQLGRGAFGTVYKGFDKDGKPVAVKQVSKADRRKASVEAVKYHYLNKKVSYKHVVDVYDVKTFKDSMWIVMEYCDIGDLNHFFRDNERLSLNEKLRVMCQIANGIAFLHKEKIVHRDIKPANILLKSDRSGPFVKLGDFGLSKILDPNDDTSSMSSDVGTILFKAPEFWDKSPDNRVRYHSTVDVYAAGLTFTAMLQAKAGHELVPEVEGSLVASEIRMPIGLAANTRCRNKRSEIQVVITDKSSDSSAVRTLKRIIERMTYFSPEARISALQVYEKLEALKNRDSLDVTNTEPNENRSQGEYQIMQLPHTFGTTQEGTRAEQPWMGTLFTSVTHKKSTLSEEESREENQRLGPLFTSVINKKSKVSEQESREETQRLGPLFTSVTNQRSKLSEQESRAEYKWLGPLFTPATEEKNRVPEQEETRRGFPTSEHIGISQYAHFSRSGDPLEDHQQGDCESYREKKSSDNRSTTQMKNITREDTYEDDQHEYDYQQDKLKDGNGHVEYDNYNFCNII